MAEVLRSSTLCQGMSQRQTPAETSPARPRSVSRGRSQRGPPAPGFSPLLQAGLQRPRHLLRDSRAQTHTTQSRKGRPYSAPAPLNRNEKLQLVWARPLPLYAQAHTDTNTRTHSHSQSHSVTLGHAHTQSHSHTARPQQTPCELQSKAPKPSREVRGFALSLLAAPPARTCRRRGSAEPGEVAVPGQGWPGPGAPSSHSRSGTAKRAALGISTPGSFPFQFASEPAPTLTVTLYVLAK